MYMQGMYNCRC